VISLIALKGIGEVEPGDGLFDASGDRAKEVQAALDVLQEGPRFADRLFADTAVELQTVVIAGLRQGHVGPDVGDLVEQEREADLGLGHAQPAQVEIDHHLAELGQARPCRLHPVPVGHVEKMNRWHVSRLIKESMIVNID